MGYRTLTVGIVGMLCLGAAAPVAEASDAVNTVTVAPQAAVAKDGTVTVSGTYRCSPDLSQGTVVSSSLTTGDETSSIGSSVPAVCDGEEHSWSSSGRPFTPVADGPVTVQASLVHLEWSSGSLIPMPDLVARGSQNTTLTAAS
ncbi:DUF6299 family protein [Streptacidiphilus carbonis]|uniref:DUF6299 family protein n=1 Tax=Streptacidiphilus carbonis TaxID=105422 RepID=UPI000B00395C|nr:DUF6299 family protein [Streptacidiphilus carbonis]